MAAMIRMQDRNSRCAFLVTDFQVKILQDGRDEAGLSEVHNSCGISMYVDAKKILDGTLRPNLIILV
jgi:hypothetical protein